MKQSLLTFITALCLCAFAYGQKTADLSLDKGSSILDYLDLQEHGFIIKTGREKNYSKNLDWQLHYYTPALQLVWSVPVETTQINKGLSPYMTATPDGAYVYHFEKRLYAFLGASDLFLTQVNKAGTIKTHELALKDMEGETMFRFCNKQYLTFINIEEEAASDGSAHVFIYQISHQDLSVHKTMIKMPLLDKSFTKWEYVTHNDEHLWLASKALADKEQNMQCQLIALDWQGKIARKTTLNHQVNNLYMRQSINHHFIAGAEGFSDGGLSVFSMPNAPTGINSNNYSLPKNTFAGLLVDEKNNRVYTYGLYGNKKAKGHGYVDGYYLLAYDLQGQKLWQQVSTESDPLIQDNFYRKHTAPLQRTTMAYLTDDQHIRLQIGTMKSIYTHEFAEEGKKSLSYVNAFENGVGYESFFLCFDPKHPATQFYQQYFSKKKSYYGSHSYKGSILIEDDKNSKISLLQW